MQTPVLPGLGGGVAKRARGRPAGSANKRNADLHDYLAAMYPGQTPGQQLAKVALVTDREVRACRKEAKEAGLDPLMLARVKRAKALAAQLGCKTAEAWQMMGHALAELMPYVHQRRPQAVDVTSQGDKIRPVIVGLPSVAPAVAFGGDIIEGESEELQRLNDMRPVEVARPKSHDE